MLGGNNRRRVASDEKTKKQKSLLKLLALILLILAFLKYFMINLLINDLMTSIILFYAAYRLSYNAILFFVLISISNLIFYINIIGQWIQNSIALSKFNFDYEKTIILITFIYYIVVNFFIILNIYKNFKINNTKNTQQPMIANHIQNQEGYNNQNQFFPQNNNNNNENEENDNQFRPFQGRNFRL